MDLIDFAQVAANRKLPEWQRQALMQLASPEARLEVSRHLCEVDQVHAFFDALLKQIAGREAHQGNTIRRMWLDEAANVETLAKIRAKG